MFKKRFRVNFDNKLYLLLRNVRNVLKSNKTWSINCKTYNKFRSSRPEVFCKKGVLWNFAKFTEKHLYQSFFFNKVADLRCATLLKETLAQVFFSDFCEISKNTFSYKTPPVAASVSFKNEINKNTLTGPADCKKTTWHHAHIYHYVQNQGKLMMQSRENGEKPQFGQFFDDFEAKYLEIAIFSEK